MILFGFKMLVNSISVRLLSLTILLVQDDGWIPVDCQIFFGFSFVGQPGFSWNYWTWIVCFGTPLLACSSVQDRVYVSCEAAYFIYSSAVKDLEYASLSYSIFSFQNDISTQSIFVASEPATCTTHRDFVVFWSRFIWLVFFLHSLFGVVFNCVLSLNH